MITSTRRAGCVESKQQRALPQINRRALMRRAGVVPRDNAVRFDRGQVGKKFEAHHHQGGGEHRRRGDLRVFREVALGDAARAGQDSRLPSGF